MNRKSRIECDVRRDRRSAELNCGGFCELLATIGATQSNLSPGSADDAVFKISMTGVDSGSF
jgi:hypothetical protein